MATVQVVDGDNALPMAQWAHRAPPATRARWQPYNSIQSTRSSPAAYLTPASFVTSASPTPPQALTSCNNDRFRNAVPPPFSVPDARELQPRDVQKSKYVVGLVGECQYLTISPAIQPAWIAALEPGVHGGFYPSQIKLYNLYAKYGIHKTYLMCS